MEGNCTREDVMEIETLLTSLIKKFTTQVRETDMPREFPVSTNFVSSNPPSKKGNIMYVMDIEMINKKLLLQSTVKRFILNIIHECLYLIFIKHICMCMFIKQ